MRLAQIDLANTRIVAPRAGRLGEVGVRQGQYVTAGTQLMGLVPDTIWVTANMKETQMKNIRVGQPVELKVDALGGQALRGRVERIAPAAGSEFSVIRPDNATGNFTKVAQRIPVRIRIGAGSGGGAASGAGHVGRGADRYGRALGCAAPLTKSVSAHGDDRAGRDEQRQQAPRQAGGALILQQHAADQPADRDGQVPDGHDHGLGDIGGVARNSG